MSVFTPLEHHELEAFLAPYGLGRLLAFSATPDGTENTNFFISLEQGEYVLTLIERGNPAELPFFVALLARLHHAHLAVPYAITPTDGPTIGQLAGKPALLQPRLPGKHVQSPNAHQCAEVGQWLAHLHLCTAEQPLEQPLDRGLDWMHREGTALALELPETHLAALRASLAEAQQLKADWDELPRANLHADLFRDNALFDGPHLSGVIDFYSACSGPMLYDLAITLNDWCSTPEGALDAPRAKALLEAYAQQRPFRLKEVALWPALLRVACLRFWLSRLLAAKAHAGRDVLIKDPEEFYQRLLARQQNLLPGLPQAF